MSHGAIGGRGARGDQAHGVQTWHGARRYAEGMQGRIVIDPNICNGRPTVRGTRITAQTIVEFLAAGDSVEDVLDEYPILTREDILACLAYSSRLLAHQFTFEKIA